MKIRDRMSGSAIRGHLRTTVVGSQLHLLGDVDSTSARLRDLARDGAPDGTVVLAEGQTAGRGRRGQPWFSPSGMNLYVSVLFRPELEPAEAGVFSFIASLAATDAIRELGLQPAIKWPNDVLVGGRKVGGALVECALRGDRVEHVIVGIGINVNVDLAALRSALGPSGLYATSLSAVLGHEVDRDAFAAAFLNALDARYETWRAQGATAIIQSWNGRDILSGRRVEVREPAGAFQARVTGIDRRGRLVVQDTLGRTHELTGEDFRLVE